MKTLLPLVLVSVVASGCMRAIGSCDVATCTSSKTSSKFAAGESDANPSPAHSPNATLGRWSPAEGKSFAAPNSGMNVMRPARLKRREW